MYSRKGFSLIELMVVIAIVAIMASIGYPSFSTLIMNNRITSQTNALLGVLQLARSEAVTQRKAMTVCPSSNQSTCAAPNNNRWANGLVIRNADVGVVRVLSLSADTPVLGSGTASVVFATDGTSAGGTLRVCDSRGDADSRTILINAAGQSRSRAFQAGDLACP